MIAGECFDMICEFIYSITDILFILGLISIIIFSFGYFLCVMMWMMGDLHKEFNVTQLVRKIMDIFIDDYQSKQLCRAGIVIGTLIMAYVFLLLPVWFMKNGGEYVLLYYSFIALIYMLVLVLGMFAVRKGNDAISDIVDKRIKSGNIKELKEKTAVGKDSMALLSVMYTLCASVLAFMGNVVIKNVMKRNGISFESWEALEALDKWMVNTYSVDMSDMIKFVFVAFLLAAVVIIVQPNYIYYSLMTVRLSEYDKNNNAK